MPQIYRHNGSTTGGYAVVTAADQYYLDYRMFHRLMDARVFCSGGTPERRGKPVESTRESFFSRYYVYSDTC